MESTGSTAPAAETPLAINCEHKLHNNLPQKSPASSPASSNMVQEMVPEPEGTFQCEYCPRTFTTAHGVGGHVKAHRHLRQAREKRIEKERQARRIKIEKERRRQFLDSFRTRVRNFPSSSRSGVVPLFAGTGTGDLAPAQPSLSATGGGGHVGRTLLQVNQELTARYISWLFATTGAPSFPSQTGIGTSGLAQPSLASPAPAAAGGNGGTGDGVHLRRQQDMPEVNPEETADGIDLTLRL